MAWLYDGGGNALLVPGLLGIAAGNPRVLPGLFGTGGVKPRLLDGLTGDANPWLPTGLLGTGPGDLEKPGKPYVPLYWLFLTQGGPDVGVGMFWPGLFIAIGSAIPYPTPRLS